MFVGAPQRWTSADPRSEDVETFRRLAARSGIGPNVLHAPYLVNLASPDPALRQRSADALANQMYWSDHLGAMGIVVHVGSGKGEASREQCLAWVTEGIARILEESTGYFLIENTAGMGQSIGADFAEIGWIIKALGGHPRVRVCLDTAHTFAAGFDISTASGLDYVLGLFGERIGLDRLAAIHANDSKAPFASGLDRHENIGHGTLGAEAFRALLAHPAVQPLPIYLEVPGFEGKGPDLRSINTLRRLAGRRSLASRRVSSGHELATSAQTSLR
jgi:deoxyribonuclease-4